MKIITKDKIQELFDLISDRKLLRAKNMLNDLIHSKNIEKMIDEQYCSICSKKLKLEARKYVNNE